MLRQIIIRLCSITLFFICMAPVVAKANDTTLLYYLMELQRKRGTPCMGTTKMPVPSIMPSTNLADIARSIASSPFVADEIRQAFGDNADEMFFSTIIAGATPKDAVDALRNTACARLMHPKYTYVGAVQTGVSWSIVLASTDFSIEKSSAEGAGAVASGSMLPDSGTGAGSSAGAGVDSDTNTSNTALPTGGEGGFTTGNTTRNDGSDFIPIPPPPSLPLQPAGPAQTIRPGITPLHEPPSSGYGSAKEAPLYSMPQQNSPVYYAPSGAVAGPASETLATPDATKNGMAPSSSPSEPLTYIDIVGGVKPAQNQGDESVFLIDSEGKQVPVVLTDDLIEENMRSGGVHIDKKAQ